ncbi:hypothetical protein [Lentilactobacillus kosonis]|uniref:hypothetical protein n=1 Tax=Lentilactobacillus kosonis TaxID=2810561 RepID=UPI000F625F2D|nr:hypothetical protein [Lentilactobacillus kosonis]
MGKDLNDEGEIFFTAYHKTEPGEILVTDIAYSYELNEDRYQFTEDEVNDLINRLNEQNEPKLASIVEMSKVLVSENEVDE